jgi:hypothetical protein
MQEAWGTAPDPEWVVWIATRRGVLTERELRLFMCFCARQNWHLLTDPRSRNVVEVAERYADGRASQEELAAARVAAWTAWAVAARVAAWTAYAARKAAVEIVAAQQAEWLRKNTIPNFD